MSKNKKDIPIDNLLLIDTNNNIATRPVTGKNPHKNKVSIRPIFFHVREVLYIARRMYALPIPTANGDFLPWGYDSILTVEDKKWAMPNDAAFRVLVAGKYVLKESSYRNTGSWLAQELDRIGYNFDYIKNYNPMRGVSEQSVNRIYKYYCPQDECLLPIDEREEAYRLEIQNAGLDLSIIRGVS